MHIKSTKVSGSSHLQKKDGILSKGNLVADLISNVTNHLSKPDIYAKVDSYRALIDITLQEHHILLMQSSETMQRISKRLLRNKISAEQHNHLWQHRYRRLFLELEGIKATTIRKYFEDIFAKKTYDIKEREKYLKKFCKSFMQDNMHAYFMAEILKPLFEIFLDIFEKKYKRNIADNKGMYFEGVKAVLSIIFEFDFRLALIIIEEENNKIINNRLLSVEAAVLQLYSAAQSDQIQNTLFQPVLALERIIRASIRKDPYEKILKIIDSVKKDNPISRAKKSISDISQMLSSYGMQRLTVGHLQFILSHIIGSTTHTKIKMNIFSENEVIQDTEINCTEVPLAKAFWLLVENAVESGATEVTTVFKKADSKHIFLVVSNNGDPMSHFQLEHCFERFFSTKPRKSGIGLYLVKEELNKSGCEITIASDAFLISLPIAQPSKRKVK